MKSIPDARHYEVNVTLDITLPRDDRRGTKGVISWLATCLNVQPQAEVTISNATGFLSRADFLDPMILHEDHPDYAAQVNLINQVEAWLELDRKALISALIHQEQEIERLQQAQSTTHAQAS